MPQRYDKIKMIRYALTTETMITQIYNQNKARSKEDNFLRICIAESGNVSHFSGTRSFRQDRLYVVLRLHFRLTLYSALDKLGEAC